MVMAVEAVGLTKVYGATRAVSDLEFRVGAGQVFGFLGPNGAGKTTTIRLLLALQRPTSGRAAVFGLDCQATRRRSTAASGTCRGSSNLYPRMTGRQHVDWFGRARGGQDRSLADRLVERFGVVHGPAGRGSCRRATGRRSGW